MAFLDDVVNVVDRVTALPGKVSRKADHVNDRVISITRDIQAALAMAGDRASDNLTQNKIESTARRVGTWLTVPGNLMKAGIAVGILAIIAVVTVRRL